MKIAKKICASLAAAVLAGAAASAQVLSTPGVENNMWTGFGGPLSHSGKFRYYGVLDTLQARVDIGVFTIEGMVNWGVIGNWDDDYGLDNFEIANTDWSPRAFHYGGRGHKSDDPVDWNSEAKDDYSDAVMNNKMNGHYVNLLVHPFKGFDIGVGTKLNWQVGPSPGYGAWVWEQGSHIRQGGFSTAYDDRDGDVDTKSFAPDAPGSADVVGFVPYANKYAKKALGVRYNHNDFIEVGAAIPSGFNTDTPQLNAAFMIHPIKLIRAAVAYEGIFQQHGNFYTGVSLDFSVIAIDAYFAWDGINTKDDDTMSFSVGAAVALNFNKIGLSIRPEATFNWFQEDNYAPAAYVGGKIDWAFADKFSLGAWVSFAWGSRDKRWDDYDSTDAWTGGFVFNIRPEVTFKLNERHSLAADFEWETRKAFDGYVRNCWSTGVFWKYRLQTGNVLSGKGKK